MRVALSSYVADPQGARWWWSGWCDFGGLSRSCEWTGVWQNHLIRSWGRQFALQTQIPVLNSHTQVGCCLGFYSPTAPGQDLQVPRSSQNGELHVHSVRDLVLKNKVVIVSYRAHRRCCVSLLAYLNYPENCSFSPCLVYFWECIVR